MHIFIDESGAFIRGEQQASVSVVGALIIPDVRLARIEQKYAALRTGLPTDEKGEVKGRKLGAREVNAVVSMLKRYEILFEATAVDMAIHEADDVARHQALQAEGITAGLTEHSHPNVRQRALDFRNRLERLP